jgi:hypothetical protein
MPVRAAGEQDRVALGNPLREREAHEGFVLDAAAAAVVEVFDSGAGEFQVCVLQQARLSALGAQISNGAPIRRREGVVL